MTRARLVCAARELIGERPSGTVTIAHIVTRAGVSRRTFYELFADREECVLVALRAAVASAQAAVLPAFYRHAGWRERIRAGLSALLEHFDAHPAAAKLCLVEAICGDPATVAYRARVLRALTDAIDEGRLEARRGFAPPPLTAEGIVGAVVAILHARIVERTPGRLAQLERSLMSLIVLPYLGPQATREELAREHAPSSRTGAAERCDDDLDDASIAVDEATLVVLRAIERNPGAQEKEIAVGANLHDRHRLTEALSRLQALDLIRDVNESADAAAGGVWYLNPRARRLLAMLDATGRTPSS